MKCLEGRSPKQWSELLTRVDEYEGDVALQVKYLYLAHFCAEDP